MSYDVTNPQLELTDPCPDIHALFTEFNDLFFEGLLARCEVKWSPRMFSCAGVCAYEGRSGLCSIRLSVPLLKLRPRKDLIETLLHEMIHAFLFVTQRNRDRDGHGPEFQYHMCRINQMANTRITIYHSFHDEVAVYKQHIWRCNGPCRGRSPYFGYVKRSSNRAPGPNDLWWSSHKSSCNGIFEKIKEPEGYGQRKRKKVDENVVPSKKAASCNTLDRYFSNVKIGRGQTCGSGSKPGNSSGLSGKVVRITAQVSKVEGAEGHSRCVDSVDRISQSSSLGTSDVEVIEIVVDFEHNKAGRSRLPRPSTKDSEGHIYIGDDKEFQSSGTHSVSSEGTTADLTLNHFVHCPSCGEKIVEYFINDHLDVCLPP
ncbi:hypothetical protein KIN20_002381 [Parelaphostrongylus tenuis]|uniref:Protein with SprT-like domain at the N terminus n=1 Tax=Parelaphostrongylus tenuis TaxID=148309 RepID=A0AAD5LXN9_PARTN|nr:hypothetical protein KIN20_002381 [Parelaphostrongylus tenuis]